MVDAQDAGPRAMFVWTIRWLAAEPEAALSVVDDLGIVPDEIAAAVGDWREVASGYGFVDGPALAVLTQIDETFLLMSGKENAYRWTPEALTSSWEWAAQRERARALLALIGEERADGDLRGHV